MFIRWGQTSAIGSLRTAQRSGKSAPCVERLSSMLPRLILLKSGGGYQTHVPTNLPEDTDLLLVLTLQPHVPEYIAAGAYVFTIGVDGKITVADRPR